MINIGQRVELVGCKFVPGIIEAINPPEFFGRTENLFPYKVRFNRCIYGNFTENEIREYVEPVVEMPKRKRRKSVWRPRSVEEVVEMLEI